MKTWQISIGGALLLFVGIQFVPVDKSNPSRRSSYIFPTDVLPIIEESCFDCHSNQTVWPWYSKIAPVSWLVAHDVNEGRSKLNFSDWSPQLTKEQAESAEEIGEEVNEGEMPMPIYLLTHPNAKLSQQEIAILNAWSSAIAGHIEGQLLESETDSGAD